MLAGLEVNNYHLKMLNPTLTGQTSNATKTLDTLITSDINTSADKALTNPWVNISLLISERSRSLALFGFNSKATSSTALFFIFKNCHKNAGV